MPRGRWEDLRAKPQVPGPGRLSDLMQRQPGSKGLRSGPLFSFYLSRPRNEGESVRLDLSRPIRYCRPHCACTCIVRASSMNAPCLDFAEQTCAAVNPSAPRRLAP